MQQRRIQAVACDARRVHQGDGGEKENRLKGKESWEGKTVHIDVKSGSRRPYPKRRGHLNRSGFPGNNFTAVVQLCLLCGADAQDEVTGPHAVSDLSSHHLLSCQFQLLPLLLLVIANVEALPPVHGAPWPFACWSG